MPTGEQEVDTPTDADGPKLWKAFAVSVAGFMVTPLIYPPLLGFVGLAPSNAGVPSTLSIQIFAAVYPLVRYAVKSYSSTSEDGSNIALTPTEAMTSLPDDALGHIDPRDIYDDAVDGELLGAHEGESPAGVPDAWRITDIRRIVTTRSKAARCAGTGDEFQLDDPHYAVAITYDPAGISRTSTAYLRFRDREAASAWLNGE